MLRSVGSRCMGFIVAACGLYSMGSVVVAEGVDLGLGCHRFREEFGMVLAVLVAQQVRNLLAMQETQETRV